MCWTSQVGARVGSGLNGLWRHTDVMSPLARRLLAFAAVLSIAVTGLVTAVTFYFVQQSAAETQMRHLAEYVGERVKTEDRLFSDLVKVHDAASLALMRRLRAIEPDIDGQFDLLFPDHGDGTRRTAARLYDGGRTGNHYVYGIGGFVPQARELTREDKALMVAAMEVVANAGETEIGHYDNFYFFTPQTRLVMFGPKRKDRLIYYRQDAPPGLDIGKEEMSQLTLPANNPQRVMKCTKLRKLISNPSGRGLNAACVTPFDIGERHVGAWGTSLSLDSFLLRAVGDALPGGQNMIVSSDGELIAAPGLAADGVVDAAQLAKVQSRERVADLVAQIREHGGDVGALRDRNGDRVVAYGRMKEPDWYFLMTFRSDQIVWNAVKTASWVLLFGVVGVVAQLILLYRLMAREVVAPLRGLAEAHRADDGAAADRIEARGDEIGALARALRKQREVHEDLLRSLEVRVAERTRELEKANQAKSVFLANMSHELRTPLNGVIAVGDRLAEESDPARRRELAALVASSGRLLEQVLGDILDVSKIEAGEFQLTFAPFDLETLVAGMAELHRASAEAKGLDFSWSVAPDAVGRYDGDAGRISQILSNLLGNAVKFTSVGGVDLSVEKVGELVRFSISDTGVGFDDAVRERLFKRFVQADQSITRQFGGTGLGLSICAALAEMMGGAIDARAVVGRGATFVVDLPLQPSTESLDHDHEDDEGPVSLEGMRVLVAEDHPGNRKVVEIVLEPFGVELTMVEDGEAALRALEARPFDAVLMDMQMPVMDGLTATRELRAREAAADADPILVIMLTANAMDEHIAAAHAAGADLHVAKPLNPGLLVQALASARHRAAAREVPFRLEG
ncbi:hybrid sensor histidine kinase/response regulator [Caulobacter vibrioides]|nr:hybrid sensor histidine kinase/response regulator [Caulobacter vibrioides]